MSGRHRARNYAQSEVASPMRRPLSVLLVLLVLATSLVDGLTADPTPAAAASRQSQDTLSAYGGIRRGSSVRPDTSRPRRAATAAGGWSIQPATPSTRWRSVS